MSRFCQCNSSTSNWCLEVLLDRSLFVFPCSRTNFFSRAPKVKFQIQHIEITLLLNIASPHGKIRVGSRSFPFRVPRDNVLVIIFLGSVVSAECRGLKRQGRHTPSMRKNIKVCDECAVDYITQKVLNLYICVYMYTYMYHFEPLK